MNVAMMQPPFMPWQGFFALVYKSQRFIFLDDFQYQVNNFDNRNRLFIDKGKVGWYSMPMQRSVSFKQPLTEAKINDQIQWQKKFWKRMQQNYSKAAYYNEFAPYMEKWLFEPAESLADKNINFIKFVCSVLGFKPEFRYSSEFKTDSAKSKRVLELLRWCEAGRYYCAKGAFNYMLEEGIFPAAGIEVLFNDYEQNSYSQIGSPDKFEPFLSVMDALMNIGPDATAGLIKHGAQRWLSWDEMLKTVPSAIHGEAE